MDGRDVLGIEHLSVDFRTASGRVHALRDVSLAVPQGAIVGIVGESGCGKSTLVNSVIGLLSGNGEIASGRILFNGADLLTMQPDELRQLRGDRITAIFQDPMTALNPVLSIGTQMTEIQYKSGLSRNSRRDRAIAYLHKVKMPDPEKRLGQYPHQFSGGMRQRICIAMALLAEPNLLIADEPTTALDATLEIQVIRLLKDLQQEVGCSILFISHHLGVVAELCDRVVIMYAGEVAERGRVREIFHDPRHPYTRKLLECDPARILEATRNLPTIQGDLPNLIEVPTGCIFRPRCPERFERCIERPEPRRLSTDHLAACHKAEQLQHA